MNTKQPSTLVQDLTDPGWREREAERMRKLFEAVPLHVPEGRRISATPPAGVCTHGIALGWCAACALSTY